MTDHIRVEGLDVTIGGTPILHSVSFGVRPGEFVTLLGPSGAGKTTALNIIAGFVKPQAGHVVVDGEAIDGHTPQERGMGFVFQDYALFPHMTVGENLEFPLRARKMPREERRRRVAETLALVHLSDRVDSRVTVLSGGQRQRVALARALVFSPRVLLLDEPLAALDKQLRETMQKELRRIQRELGVTTISVTHDQTEAFTTSDRIVIMRDGRLEQVGSPRDLYDRPQTRFVAEFLGEANMVPIERDGRMRAFGTAAPQPGAGIAVVRPEQLSLWMAEGDPPPSRQGCEGTVLEATFQGSRFLVTVRAAGLDPLLVSLPAGGAVRDVAPGAAVFVGIASDDVHVIRDDQVADTRTSSAEPWTEADDDQGATVEAM